MEKKPSGTIYPISLKQGYHYFPVHINEVHQCNHGNIEVVNGDER